MRLQGVTVNTLLIVLACFFPQDSCYESSTDPPGVSQIDTAVRLCVTVVNFAPESKRAVQMVVCTVFSLDSLNGRINKKLWNHVISIISR